jgi:hypothetical protein
MPFGDREIRHMKMAHLVEGVCEEECAAREVGVDQGAREARPERSTYNLAAPVREELRILPEEDRDDTSGARIKRNSGLASDRPLVRTASRDHLVIAPLAILELFRCEKCSEITEKSGRLQSERG